MRSDRVNYVLVGAFVLLMVVGVVIAVAALTGRTGSTDAYYTRYSDATGIKHGTRVLYMGYPVGQVEEVRPVSGDGTLAFELELAITEEFATWNVPRDSVAQVRAAGLLAAITVDIRAGKSDQVLVPGDRIRGISRNDVFGAVSDTANLMRDLVTTELKPLLEHLNHYVSSVGGILESRGGPLMDNLNALSAELAGRTPQVIDDFLATTREFRSVSRRLEETLSDENAGKVVNVVDNVLSASEDLARLAGNARTQLDAILGDDLMARARRAVENADTAAADVALASATVRQGLETVLAPEHLARMERTIENVDQASAHARDLVGPARQAKVDAILDSTDSAARELDALLTDARSQVRGLLNEKTVARFNLALVNISTAAANVARLSAHVDARVGDVLTRDVARRIRQALENFSRAAASVASLTRGLDESRDDLDALLVALRGMAEENRRGVRASVTDLSHSLDVVARHIDAVAQNLEGSSRNMLEFSRRLKANPGLLLRGQGPPPDTAPGSGG